MIIRLATAVVPFGHSECGHGWLTDICVKMVVFRELMFLRKCIDFCVIDDDTLLAASQQVENEWISSCNLDNRCMRMGLILSAIVS
jgi:hypothetical protein